VIKAKSIPLVVRKSLPSLNTMTVAVADDAMLCRPIYAAPLLANVADPNDGNVTEEKV
jgi:hypothetical protein